MKYYVYQFLNKNEEIIYIGKTTGLKNRLRNQHFTLNSHLDATVYFETEKVLASELISHEEMDIYERYLINVHSPKHNKMMNNSNSFRFELPSLEWKEVEVDRDRIVNQMIKKMEKAMAEEKSIVTFEVNEMTETEANITANERQINKYGYRVVTSSSAPILNLKLKRAEKYKYEKSKIVERNPYCRYIMVNDQKSFCIRDIEEIISDRFFYNDGTREMIKKGTIEPEDILVLEDETLKERLHVGNGMGLRFGNVNWLRKRILKQLEINRRSGRFKGMKNGWTDELDFLAKELLKIKEQEQFAA